MPVGIKAFGPQSLPLLGPNPSCRPSLTASASLAQQPASVALGIASSWTFRQEGGQKIPSSRSSEAGISTHLCTPLGTPKLLVKLGHQIL